MAWLRIVLISLFSGFGLGWGFWNAYFWCRKLWQRKHGGS